ncbi:MAG: phosphotransferase [Acidimicrobiales bacterium]|nr:phosphotransferase [Acidimicrobiales bacterium]
MGLIRRRTPSVIAQSPGEIDAAWIAHALSPPPGVSVADVEIERVGHGIGFIGDLYRCRIEWQGPVGDTDLPRSVIVKVPAELDSNRGVGEALQVYEREIVAYRDIGSDMGLPMPQHFHSDLDPHPAPWIDKVVASLFDRLPVKAVNWIIMRFIGFSTKSSRRYALVMEDIADARPPAQAEGGSLEDALASLDVLARFHASNWMSQSAATASDLIWPLDRTPRVWQASYLRNRDDFVDRFGEVIGADMVAKLDDVQDRIPQLLGVLASAPWTLQHGDYRLDNILFRPDGSLVVLDYQLIGRGRPGWDVAYFVTTALHPQHREAEEHMLRRYHTALVAAGVKDYSWQMLCSDVEVSKLVLAHRMVCSADVLNTQMADEPDSFLDLMVQRVVGWI